MIKIGRVESHARTWTGAEPQPCSVLWLISTEPMDYEAIEPSEFAALFRYLADKIGSLSCRAVLCKPEKADRPLLLTEVSGREPVMRARIEYKGDFVGRSINPKIGPIGFGDVSSACEVADVEVANDVDFWELFIKGPHLRAIAAALFLAPEVGVGRWLDAAVALTMSAGFLPFTWLPLSGMLLESYLAQVIAAGGVGVTRVAPTLCGIGLGLTGTPSAIDTIEAQLGHLGRLTDAKVRDSFEYAGAWPE